MARARLLGHIQRLRLHPISRSTTVWDEEADEPYDGGAAYGSAILVPVQLEYSSARGRAPGQGGPKVEAVARATCLRRDAVRLGWTPADGDRVTAILEPDDAENADGEAVELYVAKVLAKGKTHHGAELWTVELRDRAPARAPSESSS